MGTLYIDVLWMIVVRFRGLNRVFDIFRGSREKFKEISRKF